MKGTIASEAVVYGFIGWVADDAEAVLQETARNNSPEARIITRTIKMFNILCFIVSP